MQVDPIKHTLKATEAKRLKPKYDQLPTILLTFRFNFNLRRYNTAQQRAGLSIAQKAQQGPLHPMDQAISDAAAIAAAEAAIMADGGAAAEEEDDAVGRCRLTV